MKIAILTQPLHNNYGGNLQNFALQKVLKDLGHEPITVDRHSAVSLRTRLKLGYFKRLLLHYLKGTPKPSFKAYFSSGHQEVIREDISRFIDAYIIKTPGFYSDLEVKKIFRNNSFDAVIVGSDQVWRPKYSPNIYSYFLDFLEEDKNLKKIAYAASFGTEDWEFTPEQTERCKHLVQQFDLITLREKSAVNLVKNKFMIEAEFVLDPTLLLDKEDYENLFNGLSLDSNKGIYTYILDKCDWKSQVVETAKTKLGLEQFSNQHHAETFGEHKIPTIESWIKGFADADFVITDSFHGTVFAIIFNKPFISLVNSKRGASRFESILGELGLSERLIDDFDKEKIDELLESELNVESYELKLAELREKSRILLKDALAH